MSTHIAGDTGAASLADVRAAAQLIYRTLQPTPLLTHPLLSDALDANVRVKHENHNPTGAFKVRGGVNLIGSLKRELPPRGVITASTGNHGQSIAFACHQERIPCSVYVPVGNNPDKNAAMRAWGATVVEHGRDFDEAREAVEQEVQRSGQRYIHSANEPLLIAGVATAALELFEAWTPDVVFVPIGGGSGAMGICLVRSALGLRTRVIGVQAERADTFARSWREKRRLTGSTDTFAEGIATRVTFELTFEYPEGRARRGRHAQRSGARRRCQDGDSPHPQPGGRRGRGVAGGREEMRRRHPRPISRMRDERRKHRRADTAEDSRNPAVDRSGLGLTWP